MVRVILADDHHLVRQGIRSLLEKADDIEIVAEAENGQEAVRLTESLVPDVLVMDINMPRLNGIQATEQIHSLGLTTSIVILSMHSDRTLVRQALSKGARGYLLKRSVVEELLLAVRAASQGESYLSPAISEVVMADFLAGSTDTETATGLDRLTLREQEVLNLIAEGNTNKAIAQILHLSVKTVEKHRANLMLKLNVQDLASLIRTSIKEGLILLDE